MSSSTRFPFDHGDDPQRVQTASGARAQAAAEKAYRKANRPWYRKKRFVLPLLLLLAVVLFLGTRSGTPSTTGSAPATGSACAADYPDKQETDVCPVNGRVVLNGLAVTADPLRPVHAELGGVSLCTTVSLHNGSGESRDYNVFDFKIQTPSGDVGTMSSAGIGSTLQSGTLVPGGLKTGRVCLDDPGEHGVYVLIFKPDAWGRERGVWLFQV